jgi:dTDP-4-dehydrorhamnose 3,5-epimerase
MRFVPAPLPDLLTVHPEPHVDDRGRFVRVFCAEAFATVRPELRFVQVNLSSTRRRGTVRGLHWQRAPHADAKLIRCVRGAVWDVAVDLRAHSPTFGRWHAVTLRDEDETAVFVPEGFAHGFQSLTEDAVLLYQHTAAWTPSAEAGLRYDDPALAIAWPLPVSRVSPRDVSHPSLAELAESLEGFPA